MAPLFDPFEDLMDCMRELYRRQIGWSSDRRRGLLSLDQRIDIFERLVVPCAINRRQRRAHRLPDTLIRVINVGEKVIDDRLVKLEMPTCITDSLMQQVNLRTLLECRI